MNKNKRLSIRNLSHSFDNRQVLDEISLDLEQGQVMAIVGRSGCGKSTLLNLISGLLQPDQGEIDNSFQTTSILFQDTRLLPWKNTRDNIGWGLKAKGMRKSLRNQAALKLALEVGLDEEDLNKYPHELSGGMRQRVAMARSFAVRPELLLLDEPFSAQDIGLKEDLYSLLISEIEQRKLTVLFITHDLMEAIKLADHIVVLSDNPGRQVYTYECHLPRTERDQDYLYANAMNLMKTEEVKLAFQTWREDEKSF
ncbi:ABC transporter related protein [Vibrio nigripulchritudo ATCC 27043]|uniref:ABC transporter ATP-binding protein n=1 Tax=Vibrio nigripulchritudo TaxID=28173 RepID=UPI00021C26BC|nr:ATP-binding cassette domain-containing protein [Vibrio nigripulchritudo]EGU56252.1 ABC transporter related protein [Vibrio nigripulchritudo ATCC 27043]